MGQLLFCKPEGAGTIEAFGGIFHTLYYHMGVGLLKSGIQDTGKGISGRYSASTRCRNNG